MMADIISGACAQWFIFEGVFAAWSSKNRGRQAGQARASALLAFVFPTLLPHCCAHCSVEHPCMGCEGTCDRRRPARQRGRGCLSPGTHRFSWRWFPHVALHAGMPPGLHVRGRTAVGRTCMFIESIMQWGLVGGLIAEHSLGVLGRSPVLPASRQHLWPAWPCMTALARHWPPRVSVPAALALGLLRWAALLARRARGAEPTPRRSTWTNMRRACGQL